MKLVLLGNYLPDAQQSMLRFGALLQEHWSARGAEVVTVAPQPSALTRRWSSNPRGGIAKWLGYFDKYVVFPRELSRALRANSHGPRRIVHVVDHSNAVYVPPHHPSGPWLVTCHDLLAVRGALGEDTDCPASLLGRQLQHAIVRGLGRARAVVADSTSTLQDVERLVLRRNRAQSRRVILLGLNHPYHPVSAMEARTRLGAIAGAPWHEPFLLHVGANLFRKNKAGVLRIFADVAGAWRGNLVYAGAELPADVRTQAAALGLTQRVFAAAKLTNPQLEAAYSIAHAVIFPSTCEGFGWPVIEAQACGCPVVCSDRTSLPEVGGRAALVHALDDDAGMAASVRRLLEPGFRADVVARGFRNLDRFGTDRMIDAYGEVYEELLAVSAPR